MFDRIRMVVQTLEQELKDLDPDTLHPKDAPHLLELYSRGEKLCAAGKALAAPNDGYKWPHRYGADSSER